MAVNDLFVRYKFNFTILLIVKSCYQATNLIDKAYL